MALTKLTSGSNVANATTYTSQSISPGPERVVIAFVASFAPTVGTAPQPVLTGNTLVWEMLESVTFANNPRRRLSCFVARGAAPTAGTVTFTFTAQQDLCAWSIFEYDAVPGSATAVIGQHSASTAQNVATLSVPLNPPVTQYEVAVGGVLVEAPNQPSRVVTAGPGCNQIDIQAASQPVPPSTTMQTQDTATSGPLVWNWNGNANAAAIVLAVTVATAAPPQDPVETLVRKFEPILFFGKDEHSFPSDAKRFVEHCALWEAAAPPDDKKSWGTPRVKAGQLAAAKGEPGTNLGTEASAPGVMPEELFLELAGWLDKTGTSQPAITPTSTHPYANRGAIRALYANDQALKDSQFWYHAELFDTDRLLHLAERVDAPDLRKTAADNFKNPALLCYYLFFPEQEQVVTGAGNIEATEAGSHAGQWACIALLFERSDVGADYTDPSLIGFTGSPTVPPGAHAVDDEFRTAMKVAKWRPAGATPLPEVTDNHPHLWVSVGSHSLYLDEGDHQVAPFPAGKEPSDNGKADTPYSTPGGPGFDPGLLAWKLVAGPGGWLGIPVEAIFGIGVWGNEFGTAYPAEPVPPDASPSAGGGGNGSTVHPVAVAPLNTWPNPTAWRSARNLVVGPRRYDFIVDRATQPLWPSDDGRQGFRGRWGQRVETDPFTRRAGVRFPEFWRMFLLAFEDGLHSGKL